MDFGFTDTQKALYEAAVAFARDTLQGSDPMDRSAWSACAAQGLLGLPVSAERGGQGHDPVTTARVLEGLGYGAGPGGRPFALGAHVLAVCKPIEDFGDNDAHEGALADLISGRAVGAFATTEPGAGSDVGAITTTAVRDGDRYRISGTKCFITNAPSADLFLVTAKTAPERGGAGITAFLVPRDTPGVSVGAAEPMMGLGGAPNSEVHLDDCLIEASGRLGELNGGGAIVQHAMRWERALILAPQLGIMQRQLEAAVDHARTRVQFGKRIGAFQGVSHRIAQMAVRLDAARLLLYRGAWALDKGREGTRAAAVSKAFVSEAAVATQVDTLRVLGASGYLADGAVDKGLGDALGGLLYSGTVEVQYNLIASLLGL